MFLDYRLVLSAILLVGGLWWCKEVFGRWREDLAEIRESKENVRRAAILFYWILTLVIMVWVASFLWGIVQTIIRAARAW